MKNVLALLADWANGIFAVLLAAYLFGIEPAWWHFLVGIVLSMSPDIDAVPEILLRGKVAGSASYTKDHRTFLHYPIISLPLGVMATVLFGYWGFLWCLALCLHLLNDLYGTGWGLQLFYPFSRRHYKFFARRANSQPRLLHAAGLYDGLPPAEKRLKFVVSWSHEELPAYIARYGVDNWLPHWYLTINPTMIAEYSLFLLALILMITTLVY